VRLSDPRFSVSTGANLAVRSLTHLNQVLKLRDLWALSFTAILEIANKTVPSNSMVAGSGTIAPGVPVIFSVPEVVPKEKITSSIVVPMGRPVIMKVAVWFTNGLCALFPAMEPFALSYFPSADAGPRMPSGGVAVAVPGESPVYGTITGVSRLPYDQDVTMLHCADNRERSFCGRHRSRWDRDAISEGLPLVEQALSFRAAGPYRLQAAIAALHAQASTAEGTDWPQIAALYGKLLEINPTPVIALNHAAAIAMSGCVAEALQQIDDLGRKGALDQYYLFHGARADLLRRSNRRAEAAAAYQRAATLATNPIEVGFLNRRLRELQPDSL
jgi:hypothetical protein